jgi:hypothetical protein
MQERIRSIALWIIVALPLVMSMASIYYALDEGIIVASATFSLIFYVMFLPFLWFSGFVPNMGRKSRFRVRYADGIVDILREQLMTGKPEADTYFEDTI